MQVKKKLYCHWDLIRFITEEALIDDDGTFCTLSVTDGSKWELMIFLRKDDSDSGFEVQVYKSSRSKRYIPHESDNVKSYEENDEYATFFFDDFDTAKEFMDNLAYCHKEYLERPARELSQ